MITLHLLSCWVAKLPRIFFQWAKEKEAVKNCQHISCTNLESGTGESCWKSTQKSGEMFSELQLPCIPCTSFRLNFQTTEPKGVWWVTLSNERNTALPFTKMFLFLTPSCWRSRPEYFKGENCFRNLILNTVSSWSERRNHHREGWHKSTNHSQGLPISKALLIFERALRSTVCKAWKIAPTENLQAWKTKAFCCVSSTNWTPKSY